MVSVFVYGETEFASADSELSSSVGGVDDESLQSETPVCFEFSPFPESQEKLQSCKKNKTKKL